MARHPRSHRSKGVDGQVIERDVEATSELASEIIRSLESGEPREVYGNVRNGGLIEFESEPGRTVFTLLLPLGEAT